MFRVLFLDLVKLTVKDNHHDNSSTIPSWCFCWKLRPEKSEVSLRADALNCGRVSLCFFRIPSTLERWESRARQGFCTSALDCGAGWIMWCKKDFFCLLSHMSTALIFLLQPRCPSVLFSFFFLSSILKALRFMGIHLNLCISCLSIMVTKILARNSGGRVYLGSCFWKITVCHS